MAGIALSRLGITPTEFYQLTPLEFDHALRDYQEMHFIPMKRICETVRMVAQVVHNTTPGIKRHQMIKDPENLLRFGWERPKIKTAEEMRDFILGLAHMDGVSVTQDGKPVKVDDEDT